MSRPVATHASLASVIRKLRTQRQLTQEDLAHAAGITVASLSRIEAARVNPTWSTIRAVVAALEVSLAEFGTLIEAEEATAAAKA